MPLTPWYLWQLADLMASTTVGASTLSPPVVRLLDRSPASPGVALVIWHEDEWTGPIEQWCGAMTEALQTWALPERAKTGAPGPFERAASSALAQRVISLPAGEARRSDPRESQGTAAHTSPEHTGPRELLGAPWWRLPEVECSDLTDEELAALLKSLPARFEDADAEACARSSQTALSRRVALAHAEVLVKKMQWKDFGEAMVSSLSKQFLLLRRAREALILAARQLLELHRQIDVLLGRS
jgi:hypothetical protein